MPAVLNKNDLLSIGASEDIVQARRRVREMAVELGFSLVEQTKVVTAASELARNAVEYAGGGTVFIEMVQNGRRPGLRLTFEDHGPGIPNIELAMKDGYTTGSGLGLGLGGAKRLSNEFEISSRAGEGTRVTIVKWKA